MRYLAVVLFASLILIACSTGPVMRSDSHSASPTQVPPPGLQKASLDSVVHFCLHQQLLIFMPTVHLSSAFMMCALVTL